MDARNLVIQINDVLGEMRYLIDNSKGFFNQMDLPVISGPFSRSFAYSHKDPTVRVFMLKDVINEYYLIDCLDSYGQRLYDDLWSKRLLLYRLRKELEKI